MDDREKRSRLFEKIFLLADISMDIALSMSSLTLSNVKINFIGWHIYWQTYTVTKILLRTRQVELIEKKEFAADSEDEVFEVHVASIRQDSDVHLSWKALRAWLRADDIPTSVLLKYVDFPNIFFKDLEAKLPKFIRINDHAINLIKG